MIQLAKGTKTTKNKLSSANYNNLGNNSSNDLIYLIENYLLALENNDSTINTYKSKIISINKYIDFNTIATELENLKKLKQIKDIHYNDNNVAKWATTIWTDFYSYSKLDTSKLYPVYICEKAMLDYQNAHNYCIEDIFYSHILVIKSDLCNRNISKEYAIERGKKTSNIVDSLYNTIITVMQIG